MNLEEAKEMALDEILRLSGVITNAHQRIGLTEDIRSLRFQMKMVKTAAEKTAAAMDKIRCKMYMQQPGKSQNIAIDFNRLMRLDEAVSRGGYTIGDIHFAILEAGDASANLGAYNTRRGLDYQECFVVSGYAICVAPENDEKLFEALVEKKILFPVESGEE